MKTFAALLVILAAQGAVAASPIATKHHSSGTMAPKYRVAEEIEVFANGEVKITTNNKGKETIAKKALAKDELTKLTACIAKLKKAKEVKRSNCMGGATTSYFAGEKLVQTTGCGATAKSSESCVSSFARALDKF